MIPAEESCTRAKAVISYFEPPTDMCADAWVFRRVEFLDSSLTRGAFVMRDWFICDFWRGWQIYLKFLADVFMRWNWIRVLVYVWENSAPSLFAVYTPVPLYGQNPISLTPLCVTRAKHQGHFPERIAIVDEFLLFIHSQLSITSRARMQELKKASAAYHAQKCTRYSSESATNNQTLVGRTNKSSRVKVQDR